MKGINDQTTLTQMLKKWKLKLSSSKPECLQHDSSSTDRAARDKYCHNWDVDGIQEAADRHRFILSLALDLCSEEFPPLCEVKEMKV